MDLACAILDRGLPAFGLAPTGSTSTTVDLMEARWLALASALGDLTTVAARSLVTATCGLGLSTPENTIASFTLAREMGTAIHTRAAHPRPEGRRDLTQTILPIISIDGSITAQLPFLRSITAMSHEAFVLPLNGRSSPDRLEPPSQSEPPAGSSMHVRKRNGRLEPVDVNKIVRAVQRSAGGLPNVDTMRIAVKTIGGLFDGATTRELDQLSIQTAAALIAEEPEYSQLAARLLDRTSTRR